ncbi:hypothetical protein [Streptomyces sp. AcH 505]|uniref:hypothetical protein n=1 Tax=Streptomyces sp. AcH 505 TaxID=352211 RepID=UPI000AEFF11A
MEDGYLCLGCVKDLRVRLESWPTLYTGLALFLAPGTGGGQGRGAKPAYGPMPVSEDILDLRGPGGLVGVAEGWVSAIRRDRRMTALAPQGGVEGRLGAAVAQLLGHLPWVAVSWPDAGAFAADVREVTRSVSSIFVPPPDRGRRLGNCPALNNDGSLCGAVLRLHQGAKVSSCPWCGASWPPATWAQLKVWQDEDAKVATDVA